MGGACCCGTSPGQSWMARQRRRPECRPRWGCMAAAYPAWPFSVPVGHWRWAACRAGSGCGMWPGKAGWSNYRSLSLCGLSGWWICGLPAGLGNSGQMLLSCRVGKERQLHAVPKLS